MTLDDVLANARVRDLSSCSRDAVLLEMVEVLGRAPEVTDKERLLEALLEREDVESTGIGTGVAVPHAKIAAVTGFVVAYGRSQAGVDWNAFDGGPVHHIVLIAGPTDLQRRYLQILASTVQRFKGDALRSALETAPDENALAAALRTSS